MLMRINEGISGLASLTAGQAVGADISSYLTSAGFLTDLSSNLVSSTPIVLQSVVGIASITMPASIDSQFSCTLNDHLALSWRNYESENSVKIAVLGDSQSNWISAGKKCAKPIWGLGQGLVNPKSLKKNTRK